MSLAADTSPAWLDVSHETYGRLRAHLALVQKWTSTVNLISQGSAGAAWRRHVLDSAQVWVAARSTEGLWIDIGSGGGFPGLVAAIIGRELAPNMRFVLVESDRRKAAFLREAGRQLGVPLDVRVGRIEEIDGLKGSIVSARALAPLNTLLGSALKLLEPHGVALFPKGQTFEKELSEAGRNWTFVSEVIPSALEAGSVILRIKDVQSGGTG